MKLLHPFRPPLIRIQGQRKRDEMAVRSISLGLTIHVWFRTQKRERTYYFHQVANLAQCMVQLVLVIRVDTNRVGIGALLLISRYLNGSPGFKLQCFDRGTLSAN